MVGIGTCLGVYRAYSTCIIVSLYLVHPFPVLSVGMIPRAVFGVLCFIVCAYLSRGVLYLGAILLLHPTHVGLQIEGRVE